MLSRRRILSSLPLKQPLAWLAPPSISLSPFLIVSIPSLQNNEKGGQVNNTPLSLSSFSPPWGRFSSPVHCFAPPSTQRPLWPLAARHVAMEGHPHVRPCPLVPSPVHPLKSSFPSTSFLNPRSGSIPPLSPFPSSDSSTSLLSAPPQPPHPLPPLYSPSAAAVTAASNPLPPNTTTSIFAPSSSSVNLPLLGVPPFSPSPSAALPLSSLALSSATVSLAVSTSLTTPQSSPQHPPLPTSLPATPPHLFPHR